MSPEEYIRAGDLEGALREAKDAVRNDPSAAKSRIFLFQLECVLGAWDKARTQLEVLADMDADSSLLAAIFMPVIDCEILRGEVFKGTKTPIIFGEPEEWMGKLVEANRLTGIGEYAASESLRAEAFEAAEASSGTLDGEEFEWMADADPRLGPMLEVIMDGCYRWVPLARVTSIEIDAPNDLRDLVWTSARFGWTNGGSASGLIPVRYAGTEQMEDSALRLARRTEWDEKPGGVFIGKGQRQLATDKTESPLLQIRQVKFAERDQVTATGADV